jgi:hypothetical protein
LTEAEYVQETLTAAKEYLAVIDGPVNEKLKPHWARWHALRDSLSAHTTISLCEAWIEKQKEGKV